MTSQRILVVDDEDDLRKVLEFNLRNAGFETFSAATGREALEIATRKRPDRI